MHESLLAVRVDEGQQYGSAFHFVDHVERRRLHREYHVGVANEAVATPTNSTSTYDESGRATASPAPDCMCCLAPSLTSFAETEGTRVQRAARAAVSPLERPR